MLDTTLLVPIVFQTQEVDAPLTLNIDINGGGHVDVPIGALVGSGVVADHFGDCECLAEDTAAALSHQHPFLRTMLTVGPKPIQVSLSPEKVFQEDINVTLHVMRL